MQRNLQRLSCPVTPRARHGVAMFDKSVERFPIKKTHRFLSHCGFAPLYSGALRKQNEIAAAQSRAPHELLKEYGAILWRLRETAGLVMKTSPANIAFVKNTSEGMNFVANGFRFAAGDEVISYKHEYPANHYPWVLQERIGRCRL